VGMSNHVKDITGLNPLGSERGKLQNEPDKNAGRGATEEGKTYVSGTRGGGGREGLYKRN